VARQLATRPVRRAVTVRDPSLGFADREVAAAAQALPADTVMLAAEARAERVLAEIAAADVAHLACHGQADLQNPLDSRLALAGGEQLRLSDLLALRSQLRLAVLSACETSIPGLDLPDEVISLPTGLLQAGVGGVVASLWAVPDRTTALLMTEFYRHWRRGGSAPADALRRAQLWVRDTAPADKYDHLLAEIDAGRLPDQTERLAAAVQFADQDEDARIAAWAGFTYVGA
jgi:CHAT domain-containing protein